MPQLRDAVIVDYVRSPFSRSRPREPERDVFGKVRMDDVLADLVKTLISRNKIVQEEIDEMLIGTSSPWGENNLFGARNIAFLADMPYTVAGHGIDRQCGSSLTTVNTAAMSIMLGYSDIVISGGLEHMTRTPMGMLTLGGPPAGVFNPRLMTDEHLSKKYDLATTMNMGFTAEKLSKYCGIGRVEMDKFAYRSHNLAGKAIKEGWFKGEIKPVQGNLPDGTTCTVEVDQAVRGDTTLEQLAGLKPAYSADGQITAGNASPLNAGATAMLLMSRDAAKKYGLKPRASVAGMGWAGVDPSMMGMGPVPASVKALKQAGLQVKDIDFWEINEAFSIVPLYAIQQLKIEYERVNVMGGALAIGHPLGASGTRLAGTLARILQEKKGTYGIATLCCGGGQGVATIIKRED